MYGTSDIIRRLGRRWDVLRLAVLGWSQLLFLVFSLTEPCLFKSKRSSTANLYNSRHPTLSPQVRYAKKSSEQYAAISHQTFWHTREVTPMEPPFIHCWGLKLMLLLEDRASTAWLWRYTRDIDMFAADSHRDELALTRRNNPWSSCSTFPNLCG